VSICFFFFFFFFFFFLLLLLLLLLLVHLFIVTKSSSTFYPVIVHSPPRTFLYIPQQHCVVIHYIHNNSAERTALALPTAVTSSASQHFNIHNITVIL
jgi:hypothetical protein